MVNRYFGIVTINGEIYISKGINFQFTHDTPVYDKVYYWDTDNYLVTTFCEIKEMELKFIYKQLIEVLYG